MVLSYDETLTIDTILSALMELKLIYCKLFTTVNMNNHVHRALLENTERMRKEKDKKGNAQKRLTLLNK